MAVFKNQHVRTSYNSSVKKTYAIVKNRIVIITLLTGALFSTKITAQTLLSPCQILGIQRCLMSDLLSAHDASTQRFQVLLELVAHLVKSGLLHFVSQLPFLFFCFSLSSVLDSLKSVPGRLRESRDLYFVEPMFIKPHNRTKYSQHEIMKSLSKG